MCRSTVSYVGTDNAVPVTPVGRSVSNDDAERGTELHCLSAGDHRASQVAEAVRSKLPEVAAAQVGGLKPGVRQLGAAKPAIRQHGLAQISPAQIGLAEIG